MMLSQFFTGRFRATVPEADDRFVDDGRLIAVSVTKRSVLKKYRGFGVIDAGSDRPDDALQIPGALQVLVPGDIELTSGPESYRILTIMLDGAITARFHPSEWYCSGVYHGEHGDCRGIIE